MKQANMEELGKAMETSSLRDLDKKWVVPIGKPCDRPENGTNGKVTFS